MKKALNRLFWVLILVASGCSSIPSGDYVKIDDIARGAGAGYSIVQVDWHEIRRMSHPFMTVVPYVLVEAGSHRLDLIRRVDFQNDRRRPEFVVLQVNVELGKSYRLHWDNQKVELVED